MLSDNSRKIVIYRCYMSLQLDTLIQIIPSVSAELIVYL